MRSFILFVFGLLVTTFLSAQPANVFFSTFDAERGNVLAPARDGNLWLGGMENGRVLLCKMSLNGKVLEKHSVSFEGPGLDTENLIEFFEDTDGTLVGCGNFENDNDGRAFAFRYNPAIRQFLWAHVVRTGDYNNLHGIAPIGPGGDYVLYGNPRIISGDDAELLRLRRSTGQILPGKAKRFGIGSSDNLSQVVYHNGALYACGRFTNSSNGFFSDVSKMRNALCKVDTATLEPVWTRIGPFPTGASARLYGRDLIIDNEAIISTFSGDATGPDLFSSTVFLQKNDLAGNLLWAKQYDLPDFNGEFAEEVISVPDGYILYGQDLLTDNSRLFLLKTDKQGNPLTAVKVDFDENEEFSEIPARSKILRMGDALFFTALSQNNFGQTQGILAKTDLNGWVNDSCGFFEKIPVQLVPMPVPVSEIVVPVMSTSLTTLTATATSSNLPDLIFSKKCGTEGTCPTLPDLRLSLDSFSCVNGNPLLYYSFCNIGGQAYNGSAFFALYDKNPFTDTATLLTINIHPLNGLAPGDCDQGSVASMPFPPMPFQLDTFPRFYALLGINLNAPTPIALSSFPFVPNSAECLYINNLDSIEVPIEICGTCEYPTTFVKKLGSLERRELAYSMCASRDGNLYLAGQQDDRPMIVKLTANGEPIWVRNFPIANEPIELAEIIEDSEGMIVFCGTEGVSADTRRAIAVRYNPATDQVLWAKEIETDHPEASGIVEKEPGGNFVLRNNLQVMDNGAPKSRAEVRELNRTTGEPVPSVLRLRYEGEASVRFESMAAHQNNLYLVGSREVNTLQPLFVKMSSTGAGQVRQVTNPDTTMGIPPVFTYTDILEDFGDFILVGTGQKDPLNPLSDTYVYLERRNADGSLAWLKRYDISMSAHDLVKLPNAFAIFGWMPGQNVWGMIKTDTQGNLLEAKTLTTGPNPINPIVYYPNRQGRMLQMGDHVLMVDHDQSNNSNDILLLKTDFYLSLDDSCDLLRTRPVSVRNMPAKLEQAILQTRVLSPAPLPDKSIAMQSDSLSVSKLCPRCACDDRPDMSFSVDRILCSADSSLLYKAKVCNTGKVASTQPFEVTFYDKNPYLEPANAVMSLVVTVQPGPGQCILTEWPLPASALSYSKLYTVAGVGMNTPTPILSAGFPFPQGFMECDYTNNLDSFVVKTPVCDGCENPTTFFRTMGRADQSEMGYSLCTSSDGNVYMAGKQGNNPMITKMTPNGEIIWVRNFPSYQFPFGYIDLVEIFEDSDGFLVLCGTQDHSPNTRETVVMRYDPATNQILWLKNYTELNPEALGIFESTPGGNFTVYGFSDEIFNDGGPIGSTYYKARSEIWEVDRNTGEVIPTKATLFPGDPSTSIYFQDMVPYKGSLYCVGGWDNDNIPNSGRAMLAKLSPFDGAPEWIQGTLPDTTVQFRFFGWRNILVDNDHLIVLGYGVTDVNLPTQKTYVLLSKYTLDGALLWVKSYEFGRVANDFVSLPDGYAIFGSISDNVWGMLKTDKEGNLLTAKQLTGPAVAGTTYYFYRKNALLRLPNHLLMVDGYKPSDFTDLMLFKTDYDFNFDDSCSLLQPLQVNVQTRPGKTNPILTAFGPYNVSAINHTTAFKADSLNVKQLCPNCPCVDKPDITYEVGGFSCDDANGIVAKVRICNRGYVATPSGFNLTFYDKNPLIQAATPIYSTWVPEQPGFGDCKEALLTLDISLLQYSKLYTLAGVWKDVQTPISLGDFPFANGFAECDYANNLDSFTVQIPTCGSCQDPSTFFKTLGLTNRAEFGSSLCQASDGNVYMAGRQGPRSMISKITPKGDVLWVRNFPYGTNNEPLEVVEIIEDSEGKILICGTQGYSQKTRVGVAMRYDPVSGQVLWFKQYTERNPQILGIFEKTPGGNFVLYSTSEDRAPSQPSNTVDRTRSEVWEVNRASGEVVPALATFFPGDATNSIFFEHIVPHLGSLYCIGNFGFWDGTGEGVLSLSKLSASDGTPDWVRSIDLDTIVKNEYYYYSGIVTDGDDVIIIGNVAYNFNQPNQKQLVYVAKFAADGSLRWAKTYDTTIQAEGIAALPDGYAVFGTMDENTWGMMKLDRDGNRMAGGKLSIAAPANFNSQAFRHGRLLRLPGHLMMVDDYRPGPNNDIVLIKTNNNLDITDSCSLLEPLQFSTNVLRTKVEPLSLVFQPYPVTALSAQTTFQADSLNVKKLCPQCPCDGLPDLTASADSMYCTPGGGLVVNFRVCNLTSTASGAGFHLTFFDQNPFTAEATALYSTFVPVQPGASDCVIYPVTLDTSLLKYTTLYTLVGVEGSVQTPVSPVNFPFSGGFAECNYGNNLDSFEVIIPTKKPNLGPDRIICQGQSAVLDAGSGFLTYQWIGGPGSQTNTVSVSGQYIIETNDYCGRVARDTIQVTVAPKLEITKIIQFYPGDTIKIDGVGYTQPDTVVQNFSTAAGCDSVVINILQLITTQVTITCPADLTVTLPPNTTSTIVDYTSPTATTDCTDATVTLKLLQGPPVGGTFQEGATKVCYEASNTCGVRDTCCFTVTAQQPDSPCDVKTPIGCLRYELMSIRLDSLGQRRYRVRMTNTCSSPLQFAYIQLPNGVLAVSPKEGATYTAPGGNTYAVRNPNASPFYSVRYKAVTGSLNNGKTDVFEYTLPQQSAPAYIHVAAKLLDGSGSEAFLNTFYCPETSESMYLRMGQQMDPTPSMSSASLSVRPNPTDGLLVARLDNLKKVVQSTQGAAAVQVQVLNAQGQVVLDQLCAMEGDEFRLYLPDAFASGLYYLVVQSDGGERTAVRFVLDR